MKTALVLVCGVVLATQGAAYGQCIEIPAMTVQNTHLDFGTLPGGPVTLAQLNAAGTPVPGNLAGVTMPPKAAAAGVYNTNPGYGNALGQVSGVMSIVVPPTGAFDPVTYDFQLGMLSTEFGFTFGDWSGPANVQLWNGAVMVGACTPTVGTFGAALNTLYVSSPQPFNLVKLDTSTTAGNFVIPDVHVQIPEPGSLALLGLGATLAVIRRRR